MARKLKVDFTDVEDYVRCEEGEHVAVLKDIIEKESEAGSDMLVAKFEVVKGESTGAIVYNNFVLVQKALWRLKSFLSAAGVKSEGKIVIDLDKLIGKKVIIEVGHEEYNGQNRAKINDFKALKPTKARDDEDEDDNYEDEDEDEAPPKKDKKRDKDEAPKGKKKEDPKKKKRPAEDDEDEEDWEDED